MTSSKKPVPLDGPLSGQVVAAIQSEMARGRSIRQIAATVGVTAAMISRFLRAERAPDLRTLDRLVAALGIKVQAKRRRASKGVAK